MSIEEMQALGDRYQARFANFDSIAHPFIITRPEFLRLMAAAIDSGEMLTRERLAAEVGEIDWDEDCDES